jgi:PIN domain nuclease of toxin-antitoxin system
VRLLLDTHVALWWLTGSRGISRAAREALRNRAIQICISSISAYEIATKYRIGKLPLARSILDELPAQLRQQQFSEWPVSIAHALEAGKLPGPHRDPWDRLIMAQARIDGFSVVTADPIFRAYGIPVLW